MGELFEYEEFSRFRLGALCLGSLHSSMLSLFKESFPRDLQCAPKVRRTRFVSLTAATGGIKRDRQILPAGGGGCRAI